MKIAIRVDDLGWTPQATSTPPIKEPDVGFEMAQRFHAAMGGLPYLGAVIPAMIDRAAQQWLDSKPAGLTPAVHGWDHGAKRPEARDEFGSLSIKVIRDYLDAGRQRLGGTSHFVPPYNALPGRVIDACYHEGLHHIWGGPMDTHDPPRPIATSGVTLIPAWLPLYGATCGDFSQNGRTLLEVLPEILARPDPAAGIWRLAVLSLHLTWEFSKDPELNGLRRLVDLVREHVLAPDQFIEAAAIIQGIT